MSFAGNVTVLLVEDNPGDVELISIALRECVGADSVRVFRDGRSAVDYLTSETLPSPMLLLLDLNLPGCNGFEILEAIQRLPSAGVGIESVVLSSSSRQSDRERALSLGAIQFMTKPADIEGLDRIQVRLCAHINALSASTLS